MEYSSQYTTACADEHPATASTKHAGTISELDQPGPPSVRHVHPYGGIPALITSTQLTSKLVFCFVDTIAPWCNLTDSTQIFSAVHGRLITQSSCFGAAACTLAGQYLLRTDFSLVSNAYLISQLSEHAKALFAQTGDDGGQLSSYRLEVQLSAVALALHDVMTLPAMEARNSLRPLVEFLKVQYWIQLSTPTAKACFWALYRLGECLLE